MAEILTFPKSQHPASSHQPVESQKDRAEVIVSEADGLLSFSCHSQSSRKVSPPKTNAYEPHDGDWSNQELANIYRVKHLLDAARMRTELDRGITDEGDPWCVFCNEQGEVFIHLSRIDGLYWLDSPNLPSPLNGTSFDALVQGFTSLSEDTTSLQEQADNRKKLVPLRSGNTLFLHPSVMLAALVWSLYFGSDELLVPNTEINSDEREPNADAAASSAVTTDWLLDGSDNTAGDAPLTISGSVKAQEAQWHQVQGMHTNDGQKALMASVAHSPISMMIGLGSIAVACGLATDNQWTQTISAMLGMESDPSSETSLEDGGEIQDASATTMLAQALELLASMVEKHDVNYSGDFVEADPEAIQATSTDAIFANLANMFGLGETKISKVLDTFDAHEHAPSNIANKDLSAQVPSDYAAVEDSTAPQPQMLADAGKDSIVESPFELRAFTKVLGDIFNDSDLATLEFGGTLYLTDFSQTTSFDMESAETGETLDPTLSTATAEPSVTTALVEPDILTEPTSRPAPIDINNLDTMVPTIVSEFDQKAKAFLFDIIAREDVKFMASATSLTFFDVGVYDDGNVEMAKMTWTTDDGLSISLLGATSDFMDHGFI